ncbi:MAG: urease accessory protein UreF [Synechococcales bacterium]|nr:urease accessory protein UreF [Synechococcales bacterium]
MSITFSNTQALLRLLQLASPALPVGAYSYSEGLETLTQRGDLTTAADLQHWLTQELRWGMIRLDGACLLRAQRAAAGQDIATVQYWNQWLSAVRDSEEMRSQSWQMGQSLVRLITQLHPEQSARFQACGLPCNFAIAFALAAAHWQIEPQVALTGYLHSWLTNLVTVGVKLIPLGQTAGQQLLLDFYPQLEQAAAEIFALADDELMTCAWGAAIATMTHETLYSRLFRS